MATPVLPLDDDNDVSFPPSSSLPSFSLFPQRPRTLTLTLCGISLPQEFDWEAAVREIDDACQLASVPASTSNPQGFATPVATTGAPANLWRRGGEGRQSTLDRFVVDFHGTKRTRNDDGDRFGSRGRDAKEEQNFVCGDEQPAVDIDLEAAKTWIYPVNVPLRDYQFSITRTSLFSNTLVALPTGLGKTLIAAVVMYNYYRWFPEAKQRTVQNVIDNLHISTMEYRNESDHDVSPYVHNRTLELIQVAMSEDASVIYNLLLEAIHPYVARLCTIGVLPNRDAAKWSPCELLNSRDKFRQAPPSSLPHGKYGEVEGYFGVLITLYHIRKLLSSHGVRPASDMLQEKLRQGSFARMMSKNETILKAKLLMQRSLSHGAPNPKLKEVDLVASLDLSVRNVAELKFRTGGYNVIVATSIGEEGLNITEVDLVICFDANVSPLRMIQRMGRTGRKHDGRDTGAGLTLVRQSEKISTRLDTRICSFADTTKDCSDVQTDAPEDLLQGRTSDIEEPASGTSRSKDRSGATICTPPAHRFLFGGDFVKVNALGGVSIPSVPVLPLEGSVIYEIIRRNKKEFPSQEKNEITSKVSSLVHDGLPSEDALDLPLNAETHSPNIDVQEERGRINAVSQTPVLKQNAELTEVKIAETPGDQEKDTTSTLVGESSKIFSCVELSPRLTLFIETGIVPESPISTCKVDKVHAGLTSAESASMHQNKVLVDRAPSSTIMLDNVLKNELPVLSSNSPNVSKLLGNMDLYNTEGNVIDMDMKESASPLVAEMQIPLVNPVSSTDEWQMSSGGRKQKANKYFDNFIEEEAEVSEDAEVSVDEEDDEHDDKYEDSFIDDRTNPTEAGSQTEINGGDMLAFYRRSLLTQSPMETLPKCLVDSVSSRATGSGSCSSAKVHSSLQTPQNGLQSSNHSSGRYSISCQADSKQGYLTTMCGRESSIQRESSSKLESRKRKLSFHNACSVPARNCQLEGTVHAEPSGKEFSHYQPGGAGIDNDVFCDDEFYQSIDLDAVEAQATELLRYKSSLHVDEPPATDLNIPAGINEVDHPSFDLGFLCGSRNTQRRFMRVARNIKRLLLVGIEGQRPEQLRQPNVLSIDNIKLSINGDVFGAVPTCTGKLSAGIESSMQSLVNTIKVQAELEMKSGRATIPLPRGPSQALSLLLLPKVIQGTF
ncbi:HELICc [Musa troglodytarum]|uniref:HELICc n=1 Tax=Musa troglodytarum TaxID=320322 RepID=A0A9E7F6V0_9LILI|nr:HELICc [Musa troglodytarum]